MQPTLQDIVKAGGISSLCMFHYRLGKAIGDWNDMEIFAYREFRNISPALVAQVIELAKTARADACAMENVKDDAFDHLLATGKPLGA